MTTYIGSSCAKTILFGEHAVVYGEPAIAIPLSSIRTTVHYTPNETPLRIFSAAFEREINAEDLPKNSGLFRLLQIMTEKTGNSLLPGGRLEIESQIPIASGLGSGAALSVAVIRAFIPFYGTPWSDAEVNEMAYAVETVYHGTPSGIDNTVIVHEKPILFIKGEGHRIIPTGTEKLPLVVVDSGIRSETKTVVADVRSRYPKNAPIIQAIGDVTRAALSALERGELSSLGGLMNENQRLLNDLGVSCTELNHLVTLARAHGALGAKLTGAGGGGNMIALAKDEPHADTLREIFKQEGARVIA